MRHNPPQELLSSSTDKAALTEAGTFLEAFIPSIHFEHLPKAFCSFPNSPEETTGCAQSLLFVLPPLPQFNI